MGRMNQGWGHCDRSNRKLIDLLEFFKCNSNSNGLKFLKFNSNVNKTVN